MHKRKITKTKNKQDTAARPAARETGGSLASHLVELRTRLLRCVAAVVIVFLVSTYFSNQLYAWLAMPLLKHLPAGQSLIAIGVASPFFVPMKLALAFSFFATIPYILHQLWGFVAPGLYARERRIVVPVLVSSVVLFYTGMAFAYFVVFPLVFGFFTHTAPAGVTVMPDIATYFSFTLKLFFAFGVAFEVPVATLLLIASGVVDADDLRSKRPYVIVSAFILGMLLTPPDVISQTLLAIPLWLLFEAGLFATRFFPGLAARSQKGLRIED